MASDKIRVVDKIRTLYWFITESEVGNRYSAALFAVLMEIALSIFFGMVADNFN